VTHERVSVAAEVPFTIIANGIEVVTLLCTPQNLDMLCTGFLFTSGFIRSPKEVLGISCDLQRWRADAQIARDPDPGLMAKRLYTSGCGKGVMYASTGEIAARHPLQTGMVVDSSRVVEVMRWLQTCSSLYRTTGAVHTASVSIGGDIPEIWMDDVGRHNAVDKVIGAALLKGTDFSNALLLCSGRTSSEILFKAKQAGIPVSIARGAPTHQTVLLARDIGVTVVGFARGGGFLIYSHPERIAFNRPPESVVV
jgi:FdhD protein